MVKLYPFNLLPIEYFIFVMAETGNYDGTSINFYNTLLLILPYLQIMSINAYL